MNITDFTIGLRGHDVGNTFEQMLLNCNLHKISALQLAMPKTMSDIDFDKLGYDLDFSNKINTVLRENNITLPVLSCYINPIDTDASALERQLNRFRNFIRYARDFSADVVGTETGYVPLDTPPDAREKIYNYFIENIKSVIDVSEEFNTNIAIEPVATSAVSSPQVMSRVIKDIGSNNVKVILDTSNLMTAENYTNQNAIIDAAFSLFPDRITAIHLKDFTFEGSVKKYSVLGEGKLNAEYLLSKVSALAHRPAIILDETPLALYEKSIQNLKTILSKIG